MVDRTKHILDGAIATTRGWLHPKTGELLSSIRGLENAIEWSRELVLKIRAGEHKVSQMIEDFKEEVAHVKAEVVAAEAKVEKVVTKVRTKAKALKDELTPPAGTNELTAEQLAAIAADAQAMAETK